MISDLHLNLEYPKQFPETKIPQDNMDYAHLIIKFDYTEKTDSESEDFVSA